MSEQTPPKMSSVLGQSAVVIGNVRGTGDLEVRGRIQGSVELSGRLLIAESGIVLGGVEALVVTVAGEVRGDLNAEDGVVIMASGRVEGNIAAPRVGIEAGARVRGNLRTGEDLPARTAAPLSAAATQQPAARKEAVVKTSAVAFAVTEKPEIAPVSAAAEQGPVAVITAPVQTASPLPATPVSKPERSPAPAAASEQAAFPVVDPSSEVEDADEEIDGSADAEELEAPPRKRRRRRRGGKSSADRGAATSELAASSDAAPPQVTASTPAVTAPAAVKPAQLAAPKARPQRPPVGMKVPTFAKGAKGKHRD